MKAIYILWLRQMKRYRRSRSGIALTLSQPMIFLIALGFGIGPIFKKAGAGSYIQFLTPGVIGMTVLFTAILFGNELVWDRQFGFLKETLVSPVPRLIIMIGRTLGGATVAFLQGIVVIALSTLSGFRFHEPKMIPLAVLFMTLIALTFAAAGTAIACLMADSQGFQLVVNFVVTPAFYLSGALFPLNDVPKTLGLIAKFNPLSYGIDGLRAAMLGTGAYPIATDLAVLVVTTALLLIVGSYLFSKIQL